MAKDIFEKVQHDVDFCVVGGGMAGLCAALAAARRGLKVALINDRPVLGGNASSETRVHICGADRGGAIPHMRETGILEELRMENLYRNHNKVYSIWDTILYEKARFQPNLTLLLNCTCMDAAMDGETIKSVIGWQLTTQKYHEIKASIFADCSGDSVLAPLTGALYRMGREGREEFGEPIAPEKPDNKTMGMTCLFGAKEYDTPQPFEPLPWANKYESEADLPRKPHKYFNLGYWWVELGGEHDSIGDTEVLRDELLKIVYGLWDHIKNHGDHGADNWALDWIQFLPAKRESRRYVGEHVLTQLDVEAEGKFDDRVAYGGWTMDDHHPAGFEAKDLGKPPTIFHPAPSPYGIALRCLYSKNIKNLMFAGRNASCTHSAMSSTRVMGTACSMGQAVGVAAAVAVKNNRLPSQLLNHIYEIQQQLLLDDCYIPWMKQEFSSVTTKAELTASQGDPEPVRDGIHRQVKDDPHCWVGNPGESLTYMFKAPADIRDATLILDTSMDKYAQLTHFAYQYRIQMTRTPEVTPKAFRLEGYRYGEWFELEHVTNNYQRLVRVPVERNLEGIRFILDETWGGGGSRVYGFYLRES